MLNRKKQNFIITYVIFFRFMRDAIETFILSLLPTIALNFNTPAKSLGYVIPLFFSGTFLAKFIFSYLTNKFSFRQALLYQLSLLLLGSFLCIIPQFYAFLIGRFIQGLGIGCSSVSTSVLIKHQCSGNSFSKIWAFTGMIIVWTPVLSNAISGYFHYFGYWHWLFPLFFIFSAMLVIATYFIPEQKEEIKENSGSSQRSWFGLSFFKNHLFCHYTIIYILLFSTIPVFYTISPFLFIQKLNVPVHYYWLVTLVMLLGNFVGRTLVMLYLHSLPPLKVIAYLILQAFIASIVLLILALMHIHSVILILIPCFFVAMSYAISGPILKDEMFNCFNKSQHSAAALALGIVVSVTSILFSFFAIFMKNEDTLNLALFYVFFSGFSGLTFLSLRKYLSPIPQ